MISITERKWQFESDEHHEREEEISGEEAPGH